MDSIIFRHYLFKAVKVSITHYVYRVSADPCGGITLVIISLDAEISAIFNPNFEQASVEMIAGPPAFDTITTPLSLGGIGCFETAWKD